MIEEFKNCIHPEIRTYLDEQKVENLEQAATAADDYALTHKGSFIKQRSSNNDNSRGRPDNSQVTLGSKSTSSEQVKVTDKNDMTTKSGPICNYCKRKGHIKSEFWVLQRKKLNSDSPSPNALTSVQGKFVCSKFENPEVKSESDILREEFIPFVFDGFVS